MRDFLLKKLECFKDPDFIFNPGLHKYTYHGDVFQSVTQFIGEFHLPFDTEGKSKKKADELGVDQEVIKAQWAETNRYANEVGTAVHEWIEYYFKEEWQPLPTNPDIIHRINKFNHIFSKQLHKLEPLKFETKHVFVAIYALQERYPERRRVFDVVYVGVFHRLSEV